MAAYPEARAQLARLLGIDSERLVDVDEAREAVDRNFERLTLGLLEEAAASDDVIDRTSGVDFIDHRLNFLRALLTPEQRSRLFDALRGKIDAW